MLRKVAPNEQVYNLHYVNPYCTNPEHNPPKYIEPLDPGTYEYRCPSCGISTIFVIKDKPTC
jgi:hypothetical protein